MKSKSHFEIPGGGGVGSGIRISGSDGEGEEEEPVRNKSSTVIHLLLVSHELAYIVDIRIVDGDEHTLERVLDILSEQMS